MDKLLELRRRMSIDGPLALTDVVRHLSYALDRGVQHALQRGRFGRLGRRSAVLRPALLTNPRFIEIGDEVTVRDGARLEAIRHHAGQTFDPHMVIGDRTFAEFRLQIECASRVTIGVDVLIAGDVFISDVNHGYGDRGRHPLGAPLSVSPVTIGDGTWIGQRVCILPGVTLGVGCVVGAGAVVTKSFGDHSIVAGVPARLIGSTSS